MQCHSYTRGRRCLAHARAGSNHCIFHDPEYAEERLENSRAGGKAPRQPRLPQEQPLEPSDSRAGFDFSSGPGVIAALEYITGLELSGRITHQRSRNILRAIEIVAHNVRRLQDYEPDYDLFATIQNYRAFIDEYAPGALEEARHHDLEQLQYQLEAKASLRAVPSASASRPRTPRIDNSALARALIDEFPIENRQSKIENPKWTDQLDPLPVLNHVLKLKR